MELTETQRRHLRRLAHALHPVVRIGNAGFRESVVTETERALHDHELIKIRVLAADHSARHQAITLLAARTGSALVTRIGHVAVLYRPRPGRPQILLPAAS